MDDIRIIGKTFGNEKELLPGQFLEICGERKVIVITSFRVHEGKSTASEMLSEGIAKLGKKVLLVEADLRSRNHIILKNHLNGVSSAKEIGMDCVKSVGAYDIAYPKVVRMKAGEVIQTAEFIKFIEDAREIYDLILIDTPPLNLFEDARVLSEYADGVALVRGINNKGKDEFPEDVFGVVLSPMNGLGGRRWKTTS